MKRARTENEKADVRDASKCILPRKSILFRVESGSHANPTSLFYAYFSGNLKNQFELHKKAWISRCGSEKKNVRVIFVEVQRDLDLLQFSMNNYHYDDPTTQEEDIVREMVDIARERITDKVERECVISAFKEIYGIVPNDEMNPANNCNIYTDYTLSSFTFSHLNVDGWVRLARKEEGNTVEMDEVMLLRHVFEDDLEVIGEFECSVLDANAPTPAFIREDFVQPEIFKKTPVFRREAVKGGEKQQTSALLLQSIHERNDLLNTMALQHTSQCILCSHPCSTFDGEMDYDALPRPFCSVTCQSSYRY